MLSAIWEAILALLAALGLVSLGLLVASRWLFPAGTGEDILAVVPARSGAQALDQRVALLLRLRRWGLFRGRVAVADCGLDEEGRAAARLLCAGKGEVLLCRPEDLPQLTQGE